MKNMDKILEKMGLPTGGKNTKMNMNSFQSHMKSNIGKAKQRERMLRKLEERRNKIISQKSDSNNSKNINNKYSTMTWGDNINVEKTDRNEKINKKKKKRKKKNKNKN